MSLSVNGSNESEIREICKNGWYLQNVDAIMPVPHVALCVCLTATMNIIANAHIYAYIPSITLLTSLVIYVTFGVYGVKGRPALLWRGWPSMVFVYLMASHRLVYVLRIR